MKMFLWQVFLIELRNEDTIVDSTVADSNGERMPFRIRVEPGDYSVVEFNSAADYPLDVSDEVATNLIDDTGSDNLVGNTVAVSVDPYELDGYEL